MDPWRQFQLTENQILKAGFIDSFFLYLYSFHINAFHLVFTLMSLHSTWLAVSSLNCTKLIKQRLLQSPKLARSLWKLQWAVWTVKPYRMSNPTAQLNETRCAQPLSSTTFHGNGAGVWMLSAKPKNLGCFFLITGFQTHLKNKTELIPFPLHTWEN